MNRSDFFRMAVAAPLAALGLKALPKKHRGSSVLWVDGRFNGFGDGSQAKPYKTMGEAIDNSMPGDIIAIEQGHCELL